MALLIELTVKETTLNNVLRSIIINSDNKVLNKMCKDIIAKDLMKRKPQGVVHCYTLKELYLILDKFKTEGFELEVIREIIPNHHELGIVREVFITPGDYKLDSKFCNKFRYYIFLKKGDAYFTLTFNPEVKSKKQVHIKLDNDEVAHCQVLQTKNLNIREIEKEREVEDSLGTYIVYKM